MIMSKGYLDIQRLNGYSHTQPEGPLRKLTYAVDLWIEKNTALISKIVVSTDFYGELLNAVGYDVETVDTLVGEARLLVKIGQIPEIEVS
jgi:hypothetical protein